MRVVIGIPHTGVIKVPTVKSLIASIGQANADVHFMFSSGTYVHKNRNELVTQAQRVQADYLMFIDTDIEFPFDGIKRLLDSKKDVIGAAYNRREIPLRSTLEYSGEMPTIPFQCDSLGTGFMLIDMKVFEKMTPPYFFFSYNKQGQMIGEDVYFCHRARDLGIEVWCDPTIIVKHYGDYAY